MRVIDLAAEHRDLFAICLEDWSAEAKEAGPRRAQWIERFLARGLRAKLAVDDAGKVGGMIQYLPIAQSCVQGTGLYLILCIWIPDLKHGGFRGSGTGTALLEAAEADARQLGAQGMAAWGIWLPFWMKASWFKRHGYRKADRRGMAVLLWKPFSADAEPPRWYPRRRVFPDPVPGKVNITAFVNGWCMAGNLTAERARRAAVELGDKVAYVEVDTSEPGAVAKWGVSDAVFVDGREVRSGPPPTYEKMRAIIAKRIKA